MTELTVTTGSGRNTEVIQGGSDRGSGPSVEERGCGMPQKGGIYWRTMVGGSGPSIDTCLLDPPIIVPEGMKLSAKGVRIEQQPGTDIWHVFDYIGEEHYPEVWAFWSEVRRLGLSRRIPKTADFSKLDHRSMIYLVHRRAYVENYRDYLEANQDPNCSDNQGWQCPTRDFKPPKPLHPFHTEMCVDVWRHDLDTGHDPVFDGAGPCELVVGKSGSTIYYGYETPEEVVPEYRAAIFAKLPCHKLLVYKDDDNSHEDALNKARAAKLKVEEV